jgi:hypothetical protein
LTKLSVCAQKTEIIHQSGFKHDYVVSKLQIIEEVADTLRLNYVAELRISGEQTHLLSVADWLSLLKTKAKELGANAYRVSGFSENETSVVLNVRLYFAGEKFIKINKQKVHKNSVVLFNQTRFNNDTASFYLNDSNIVFNAKKPYVFLAEPGKVNYIGNNSSGITARKILFKKPEESRFFIIPANKKTFVVNRSSLDPNSIGLAYNGVILTFGRNATYSLSYEVGRLLYEIYK